MKNILIILTTLSLLFYCNYASYGQIAGSGNDLSSLLPLLEGEKPGDKKKAGGNPEHDAWPKCTPPADVSLQNDKDESVLVWSKSGNQAEYEIEVFYEEDGKEIVENKITTKKSKYVIPKTYTRNYKSHKVRIRKICYSQNGSIFHSDWVVMASVAPCNVNSYIFGENILCPVSANLTAHPNDTANYSYLWNTSETTPSITVSTAGEYHVTITRGACSYKDTFEVNQAKYIDIEEQTINICNNSARTISAYVIPTGNVLGIIWQVAPYGTQNWQNVTNNYPQGVSYSGTNTLNLGIIPTNNLPTGNFHYKIIANIICGNSETSYPKSDEVDINFQNCDCSPSISPYIVECPEGPFTLTASEGSGYSWGHGPTTRQILLDPPNQTTNYTVTVTCDNGGTGTATAVVNMDGCNGEPHAIIETVQCIPGTTLYEVLGTVYIPEPDGNQVIIHDVEGNVVTTVPTNTNTTEYSFTLDDLTPDNQYHYVQFSEGGFENYEKFYFAPAQCLNIPCNIYDVTATPTSCIQPDNEYDLSVTFSVLNPPARESATITVEGHNVSTTIMMTSGQTTYTVTFEGLSADGIEHRVLVTSPSCNGASTIYQAPDACSELPTARCNDPYTLPNITNLTPLQTCIPGRILTVAGIPFKVTQVSIANGSFTGEGQITIPFAQKPLKVTFSNIQVNTDYEVFSGEVKGVRFPTAPNYSIPAGTINFGGDICVVDPPEEGKDEDGFDKVTGFNDRGFKRDGLFYPDSTRHDPRGYDITGMHRNGTPYDEFGCDVNGMDENGQVCVRDSVVKAFIDTNTPLISGKVDTGITNVIDDLTLKLTKLNCDSIKTKITASLPASSDNKKYIAGVNDEYINPGMSALFTEEPKPLTNNSGRDSVMVTLEQDHINLYKCDLFSIKYNDIIDKLDTADVEKIKTFVKQKLKTLNRENVDLFSQNEDKFAEWIMAMILEYLESGPSYGTNYQKHAEYDYAYLKPEIYSGDQSKGYNPLSSMAGDENFFSDNTTLTDEDKIWMFEQGFREIDGVSRGLYLEELYNQMIIATGGASGDEITMPIALTKSKDANNYNIYLDNITISPAGGKLDAYFVYQDQNSDKKFVMEAQSLNWGLGGMIGETKLNLKTNVEIRLSNAAMLRLLPVSNQGSGGCFVTWDCSGFQRMGVDAEIELCRDMVIPLDPVTLQELPNERYSIRISMEIASWSDFYFEINGSESIRPFTTPGNKEMKWLVHHIAVDMSDAKSPTNIQMFEGYHHPLYTQGNFAKEWRGFYMGELSVTMPNSFSSGGQQVQISVEDIVIDDMGVSGSIAGNGVLTLDDGNLSGWPFSIDEIKITILHNKFLAGGMRGKIKIPVFEDPMTYAASVAANKYIFTITLGDTLHKMNALLADVTLFPATSITVTYENDQFVAIANLSGKMDIKGGNVVSVNFPEIQFNNFRVSNKEPHFDTGTWQTKINIKANLYGFEVALRNIKPFTPSSGELGISFVLDLTLPAKLSASGGFEIIGKLDADNKGRQKWVYKDFNMNSFGIDVKFSAGHIIGYLETFKGHATYGRGFRGRVSMEFTALGKVDCMALFGRSPQDVKYFFIDASVDLAVGIPAPPLSIDGFVGGVAYHMDVDPATSYNGNNFKGLPDDIGKSISGATYSPNSSKGLYLKAGVKLSLSSSKITFNGIVAFEIMFNSDESDQGGGVAWIAFDGKGQFMAENVISGKLEESEGSKPNGIDGSLIAHIRITYDFNNDVLSGRIVAFLKVGNIMQGAGDNGKMVDADIHISKEKWYIYIGTPTKRCGITTNILGLKIEFRSYLDIGSVIPDLPDLPANVRVIAPQVKKLSPSAFRGGGFLFGASLEIGAKIDVGIASGELKAACGFDVILKNYGKNAKCAGDAETLGINGWYAMGQVYAYMEGNVKVMGVNVLSAGMAAVLQAQLPNPFFAQATVGVRVKTWLGSFNKSFKVELGEFCAIQTNPDDQSPAEQALGMRVFSNITPTNDSEDMETETKPLITCNVPFNEIIETGDSKFEVKMKEVKIQSLKNNYSYSFTSIWNGSKDELELDMQQIFAAYDSVKIIAIADVFKNNVKIASDTIISIFTLGKSLDGIPHGNIEYSYPMNGMHNFHKDEYNRYQGFIQLKSGMPELFYNIPQDMDQVMKLTVHGSKPTYFDYKYDGLNGKIVFPMDPAMLTNEKVYSLEIVRLPSGSYQKTTPSKGVDINTQANQISMGGVMGYPSSFSTQSGSDSGQDKVETSLYQMFFRVSKYNKFQDKFVNRVSQNDVIILNENFDAFETENIISMFFIDNIWLENQANNALAVKKNQTIQLYTPTKAVFREIGIEFTDDYINSILNKKGITKNITESKLIDDRLYKKSNNIYIGDENNGKISFEFIKSFHEIHNTIKNKISEILLLESPYYYISIYYPLDIYHYNIFTQPQKSMGVLYKLPSGIMTSLFTIQY